VVQNLSAHAETGAPLVARGALRVALLCARDQRPGVSAVAAGVLSNLALHALPARGAPVRAQLLAAGVSLPPHHPNAYLLGREGVSVQ
jgi:hypothetical protein